MNSGVMLNINSEATQTRAQLLATQIEKTIAEQGLAHGDPLGTLDSWRDQTGFARSTVSAAVRLMIDRGAIEIRPGRGGGIFVAEKSPVVRLRHTLLTVHGEATTVQHAIELRDALEPLVDTDAATHRTKDDITDLRRLLRELAKNSSDTDTFMRSNWALHERIAEITPNPMLKAVYLSMTECIVELSAHADSEEPAQSKAHIQDRYDVHAELVEAIIAGDSERTTRAVLRHAQ
jgi:DNA-binding FadR family transcriptional regulator